MRILDTMDELDTKIVNALAVDGRASYRLIAAVLGVSDQTIARRLTRLHSNGQLRVLGATEPAALGETQWYLRARCTPNAAVPIAEALTRRDDTSWVTIISGGTEVVCSTRARTSSDTETLLLRDFPRTPRVLDVTAQCELHVYTRGLRTLLAKGGALESEQVAALQQADPVPTDDDRNAPAREGIAPLDSVDRAVLEVLRVDGRTATNEIAQRVGASPSTVARRVAALRHAGVLTLTVDVDPADLDLPVRTLAWISVEPKYLDTVAQQMAGHRWVGFAAATTGQTNLYASIFTASVPALHRYLTTEVAALPGVRSMETALTIRRLKRFAPTPLTNIPAH